MDAFPKNLMPKKDAFPSLGSRHLVIWRDFVWSFGVFGLYPHSVKTINRIFLMTTKTAIRYDEMRI